jgi:hypothetical protein
LDTLESRATKESEGNKGKSGKGKSHPIEFRIAVRAVGAVDALGKVRLFRNWKVRLGAIGQACGIEVVARNEFFSVVEAVERPDVEGARVGEGIEALVHCIENLGLRPRVVPEPGVEG